MGRNKAGKSPRKDSDRRITEDVHPHGASALPPVSDLNAQALEFPGVGPAIAMIQPTTVAHILEEGSLVYADATEFAVRHHGGRKMTVPIQRDAPAPGWRGRLTLTPDGRNDLVIYMPGDTSHLLYDGSMPVPRNWRALMAASGNQVVVVTGQIATVADIEPVIRSGRATQVTVRLDMVG